MFDNGMWSPVSGGVVCGDVERAIKLPNYSGGLTTTNENLETVPS